MPMRRAWRVVAASVPGAGHARAGLGCDDALQWAAAEDGSIIAAIGDGAGSAAHGGEGARIAVRTAIEHLAGVTLQLADDASLKTHLDTSLRAARAAVTAAAADAGLASREYATTLIVMALSPDRIAVGQVGDGAVVIADEGGRMLAITSPFADEYINETTFLTSSEGLEASQIVVWRGAASRVGAFTDGLQQLALKMPAATPHAPFFTPLFEFASRTEDSDPAVEQLEAFLRSPRIAERADDDLTLFLAARVAE